MLMMIMDDNNNCDCHCYLHFNWRFVSRVVVVRVAMSNGDDNKSAYMGATITI